QVATSEQTCAATASRRLLEIAGIGRPEKDNEQRREPVDRTRRWRPPTAELLTGLYGYRFPLVFEIVGGSEGVRIGLGTWSVRANASEAVDRRIKVVESVLRALYPVVEIATPPGAAHAWPLGGIALGVPAPAGIDRAD